MSELAPRGDRAEELPPRQPNPLAIASLVSGLLVCIPLIAGSLAILLGLLGLKRSARSRGRRPGHGRRGPAPGRHQPRRLGGRRLRLLSDCPDLDQGRGVAERFIDDLSRGRVNSAASP